MHGKLYSLTPEEIKKDKRNEKVGIAIVAIISVIFITIISNSGEEKKMDTSTSNVGTSSMKDNTEKGNIMITDYTVLYKDYTENPIAADEKYRWKILQITGNIDTIDREISQNPYVTFEVEFFKNIKIIFSKSQEKDIAK
jgi:hypothetical protein